MSGPVTAGEATALESAEARVVPTAEVEIIRIPFPSALGRLAVPGRTCC
jgi:hypothetical protein